jgi:hypothetical protein
LLHVAVQTANKSGLQKENFKDTDQHATSKQQVMPGLPVLKVLDRHLKPNCKTGNIFKLERFNIKQYVIFF